MVNASGFDPLNEGSIPLRADNLLCNCGIAYKDKPHILYKAIYIGEYIWKYRTMVVTAFK